MPAFSLDARKPSASSSSRVLTFEDSQVLAKKYGIPTPRYTTVSNEEQLRRSLRRYRYPIVMKLLSPDAIHKSDVGGVVLNVSSEEEALHVFRRFSQICKQKRLRFKGALIQEQVEGTYVLVGLKMDPQFGPVVAFGLGGIFVEILRDVSFRVCPVSDRDIEEMIHEIRGYPILAGARGEKPVNMKAIKNTIKAVSALGMKENIKELDLNPLVVSHRGAWAVDVRVIA